MENITKVINDLQQLDYKSLTAQECVQLMEEIKKLDDIIKQKLTNALLRHSRRYRPFYEIESYSIETTSQGNKVFNAYWKEPPVYGMEYTTEYDTVTIEDFNAVDLSDDRGRLQLLNLLNIK